MLLATRLSVGGADTGANARTDSISQGSSIVSSASFGSRSESRGNGVFPDGGLLNFVLVWVTLLSRQQTPAHDHVIARIVVNRHLAKLKVGCSEPRLVRIDAITILNSSPPTTPQRFRLKAPLCLHEEQLRSSATRQSPPIPLNVLRRCM